MRLLRAAAWAAALSGIPSTAHALATGRDPLEAAYAAGTIVLRGEAEPARLLAAGVTVHLAISLGWTVALDRAGVRSARRAPSQDSRSQPSTSASSAAGCRGSPPCRSSPACRSCRFRGDRRPVAAAVIAPRPIRYMSYNPQRRDNGQRPHPDDIGHLDVLRPVAERCEPDGFSVEATDGGIGKIDEATGDVGRSQLIVDTGPGSSVRRSCCRRGSSTASTSTRRPSSSTARRTRSRTRRSSTTTSFATTRPIAAASAGTTAASEPSVFGPGVRWGARASFPPRRAAARAPDAPCPASLRPSARSA